MGVSNLFALSCTGICGLRSGVAIGGRFIAAGAVHDAGTVVQRPLAARF